MSKIYISYRAFPNCYEATQYSKGRAGMSAALRLLAVIMTIPCCFRFADKLSLLIERNAKGDFIFTCVLFLCVIAFDFYAFIWRVHQTNYGLNLIFIDEAYRRAAVYGEEKRSEEFISKCEERRENEKKQARINYWRIVKKSAMIYSACALVAVLAIVILTIL